MNPASRDGWPPSQASAPNAGPQSLEQDPAQPGRQLGGFGVHPSPQQQPSQQPSNQPSGHVLPPPSTPFFSPGQASGHNLPALAGLAQPTQGSPPGQPAPRPQSSVQDTGYSLPAINQAMPGQQHTQTQPNLERERDFREDREKESLQRQLDEAAARDTEAREREMRQRQQQERAQHENHTGPIHLHQPVAVPPQVRAMHGPNGLLGNAAMNGPNHLGGQLGAPNGPGNLFSGNPAQQPGQAQQTLMVPFGGAQGVQQASLGMGQGQQPILNDALSYLDQVKVQFVAHPDVYNRFLDIMKDFKSGAIDTPGVIDRVSSLFAGNPNLIQGFNTFLPPGYKIECGTRDDPNAIRVTTPMGTTVSAMPVARPFSPQGVPVNGNGPALSERQLFGGAGRGPGGIWQPHQHGAAMSQDAIFSPDMRALEQSTFGGQLAQSNQAQLSSPEAQTREQQAAASAAALAQHQQEQRGVSQLQNAVSAATGGALPRPGMMSPSADMSTPLPGQGVNGIGLAAQHGGQGAMEKRGPVEFNHAISYVNKIKNRFASQPDIYKQFLEILQTYQRESKPIQDVYAQVTHLFNSAPDLLEDFKQFLPESAAQAKAAEAQRRAAEEGVMLSNIRGESSYQAQVQQMQQTPRADQPRLPPMGNFAPTPTANRENKRKRPDRQGVAAGSSTMASMAAEASGALIRTGFNQGGNASKRSSKHQHGAKQAAPADVPAVSPTLTPALPEPLPPTSSSGASTDELNFFDRCKKFIGNKNTMNEFLKLCNLFSMDLIDKMTLVHRAQNFIGGNPELMAWFKKFLNYDGKDELIENVPKAPNSRVSLANCRGYGPSYRLLPKRDTMKRCSGRDELCRSVLNDEWASHPTWASEDSGFVAHRKNMHEDALHRIEEERHDYDHNIEACTKTIQLLEPIALHLKMVSPEERLNQTLPEALGGASTTIYKRVLMKIYGRAIGQQVVDQLFAQPYLTVPIVLSRLRQKQEEWKAAQREWEKVWREQTQKIFWKSLDHQSLNAKQADKRQFQTKVLQSEIQVKFEEQKRQREVQGISNVPKYQYEWSFDDPDVLLDACRLLLIFAEHSFSTDYPRLTTFIKEFVPLFFGLDPVSFEQQIERSPVETPSIEAADEDTPGPDDGPASPRPHKTNGKRTNLLRGVLDRGRKLTRHDNDDSITSSRGSTPDIGSAMDEDTAGGIDTPATNGNTATAGTERWLEHPVGGNILNREDIAPNEPYRRTKYNMYGNVTIYCFFRMFVILYERLYRLKQAEDKVHETVRRAKAHKPAFDLRMVDKLPQDFFEDTSPTANYYQQILKMFEDQIRTNFGDMALVEDTLRRFYLHAGWQMYTVDKMLSALTRFAIGVLSSDAKDKTWEIYQLFKKDRVREETTHQDELNYRKQVDRYAKDGEIYRVIYDQPARKAFVQIFKKDDGTFDSHALSPERRWQYYVNSYTSVDPTEGVKHDKVNIPFLRGRLGRTLDSDDAAPLPLPQQMFEENLTARIIVETFGARFEPKTADILTRNDTAQVSQADAEQIAEERFEKGHEKLEVNNIWMKDLSKDEVDAKKQEFGQQISTGHIEGAGDAREDEEMMDA